MEFLKRGWPWMVASAAALAWGFVAIVTLWLWWLSALSRILRAGFGLTASGRPAVSGLSLDPSWRLTAALTLFGSVLAVGAAIGLYHLFRKAVGPCLFAALAGSLGAALVQVGLSLYSSSLDPPEARVGTILGMMPAQWVGLGLVVLLPGALAAVALFLLARRQPQNRATGGAASSRLRATRLVRSAIRRNDASVTQVVACPGSASS